MDRLPTVFVPGLLATNRMFRDQLESVWPLGPVMVADHVSDQDFIAMAERLLVQVSGRFNLVGFSMGGYLAFEILRQAPERVARLALLDTSARPDTPAATTKRQERIALAQSEGIEAVVPDFFTDLVAPKHQSDTKLKSVVSKMARQIGVAGFVRQQIAIMNRVDSLPDLASIEAPTLIMVGDQDQLTPAEIAEEMAHGIDDVDLVRINDSGHLAPLEQPEMVTGHLTKFFGPNLTKLTESPPQI